MQRRFEITNVVLSGIIVAILTYLLAQLSSVQSSQERLKCDIATIKEKLDGTIMLFSDKLSRHEKQLDRLEKK